MPRPVVLRAVVLGVSTGGLDALRMLLGALPASFPLPILVVQHVSPDAESALPELLGQCCPLRVKEADEEDRPQPGTVYLAPPNYHLQVEPDGGLSLSTDPPVNFARPSVDVLFETAAAAYGPALAGVILTGAGSDGSLGLKCVKARGGLAIVQDPGEAACDAMPRSALQAVAADHVTTLADLPRLLLELAYPDPHPGVARPRSDHGQ
jgi:two-component system chemotaxis response regulator CheB